MRRRVWDKRQLCEHPTLAMEHSRPSCSYQEALSRSSTACVRGRASTPASPCPAPPHRSALALQAGAPAPADSEAALRQLQLMMTDHYAVQLVEQPDGTRRPAGPAYVSGWEREGRGGMLVDGSWLKGFVTATTSRSVCSTARCGDVQGKAPDSPCPLYCCCRLPCHSTYLGFHALALGNRPIRCPPACC